MAILTVTLRTVTGAGALDQFLPDYESLSLSPIFSQAGAVSIKYPANGKNFSLLHDDVEIAVIVNGTEVGELRCIIESSEGNDVDEHEDGAVWTFTARTMLGLLDRAVVYPKGWPLPFPAAHDFVAATPGKMLVDLLTRAQSRGALSTLTWDFSATVDSAGQAWGTTLDYSFDAGMKYSEAIGAMVDDGLIEVVTNKRLFRAFKKDTLGVDKSVGSNPLRFTRGRDVKESPRKSTVRELSTVALLSGDNNRYVERTSSSAVSLYGRRETHQSFQGAQSFGALAVFGDLLLETVNRPTAEITHSLFFDEDVNPTPVLDFSTGDWGLSDVGRGWEKYRIKQWVLDVSNDGEVSGSVTLNDLLAERIEKLNKKLSKISSGTSGTGGSEEKDEGKIPSIPTNLQASSQFYLVGSQPRALVTVTWTATTTNTDTTPIEDLEGYKVTWKYAADTAWRQILVVDKDEGSVTFDNVLTNSTINVKILAFNKYNRNSGWSGTLTHSTAQDVTAPPKPSAPVVSSSVGVLRMVWDGKDYQGLAMPSDFAGVEVHIGPNGTFTPTSSTLKDFITSASPTGVTFTSGLSYGTEYWIRLVAVDTSGNKSAASDETSTSHAVLKQVVSVEIGTGQVGLANTRFSDVGNLVEDGSFEIDSVRTDRTAQMTTSFSFSNTVSSNGTWSLHAAGSTPYSAVELILQDNLPVKPGERIFGAADYRASASSDVSSTLLLIVRWYDKNGAQLDSAGTVNASVDTYYVLATNFNVVPRNDTWVSRVTGTSKVAPPNAVTFKVALRALTHFSGSIWIDAVEVRRQIDTLLVADAAITSAKIGSLQVNDAHMANVSIGKLIAGSLTADMTVSARIKTANTGARVELNSAGIGAWNSGGTQTVNIASSTGNVTIIGELKSGTTGERIEVNPANSSFPIIRFYPSSGNNYGFLQSYTGTGDVTGTEVGSGSFTASGNTTSRYRLNLGGSTGATLNLARLSDAQVHGPEVLLTEDGVYARLKRVGESVARGFLEAAEDYSSVGTLDPLGGNKNYFEFSRVDGYTRHLGKWPNGIFPTNFEGLITGTFLVSSASSFNWTYGPTMLSAPLPIVTCVASNFGTSTPTPWGVTSQTTTGFSVAWNNTQAMRINFWCFRI